MKKTKTTNGFTSVELLVTLFVAVAFLMSGYQLYNMIIKDGGEARARAKASNIAYKYLQQKQIDVLNSTSCISSGATPTTIPTAIDDKPATSITYKVSCPQINTISQILITVGYNYNGAKIVTNSTYVYHDPDK